MIKYIFIAVLLCSSVMSQASDRDWHFTFESPLLGTQIGTSSSAIDGYDAHDEYLSSPYVINRATYHQQNVNGWTGPTGFYTKDIASPLQMTPGYSHTWRMYVWGDTSLNPDAQLLTFIWYNNISAPFDKMQFTLTYVRSAVGIMDTWNTVGTTVLLSSNRDGYSMYLPVYRTTNGLDGYIFDITATVIPEPSALLALAAGLAGAGLKLRKR